MRDSTHSLNEHVLQHHRNFELESNFGKECARSAGATHDQTQHEENYEALFFIDATIAEASNVKRNSGNSDHTFCAPHTDRSQLAEKCAQSAGTPHGRIRHASNDSGYS